MSIHAPKCKQYKYILAYFIRPLLKYKPSTISRDYWLEFLFGTTYRTISQYECLSSLDRIPGLYKPVPLVFIKGYSSGTRTVLKGVRIFVRHDSRYPNVYELEAPIAIGGGSKMFQMTKEDWNFIKPKFKWISGDKDDV